MKQYFGLRPTGRQFKDSGSTLVELIDESELKHTAIVLYDPFLEDADLGLNFRGVLSFLEYPMVTGLVELKHHDLITGVFVYPTGPMWTVRELLRMAKDRKQPIGLRAALEIGVLGGQILVEASDTGAKTGCFSHGSLNPWRIALKPDGELQVFGYGVPQVEIIAHQRDPNKVPPPDAIRYVPPERLEQEPEELAADTFALMLMVAEVATGRRVHDDQSTDALFTAVREGDTVRRVHRLGLSRPMAALFAKSLSPEAEARLTGPALVEALHRELDNAEGPTLEQVMEDVLGHKRVASRRAGGLVSVATGLLSRSNRPDDEPDERWSKPDRGGSEDTSATGLRRRRQAIRSPLPDAAGQAPEPTEEEASPPETTGAIRRARRKPMSDPGDAPRKSSAPPRPDILPKPDPVPERPRRRQRTGTFARPTPIGDRIPSPAEELPPPSVGTSDDETGTFARRRRKPRRTKTPAAVTESPPEIGARAEPRRPRRTPTEGEGRAPQRHIPQPEDQETEVGDLGPAPELPLPPRARRGARPPGHTEDDPPASPDDSLPRRRRRRARRNPPPEDE
ncbi:MAG: hypothetical protein AAGA48_05600 [Myxococcota bacterium]